MERERIVCIGGATVDRFYRSVAALRRGTSNPVTSARSFGGVARNVAENLSRLGVPAALVSVVGADENGRALKRALAELGVDVSGIRELADAATAEYVAVTEPSGELGFGLADMAILDRLTPDALDDAIEGAALLFADCNLPAATLAHLIARRREGRLPRLAVDAVSVAKVARLPADLNGLDLLFLNEDEAGAVAGSEGSVAGLPARGVGTVVLTRGPLGVIVADRDGVAERPAVPVGTTVDVTGAGDALVAATLMRIVQGDAPRSAVRAGLAAAALTLEHAGGVRPDLSSALLDAALRRDPS
jgi:pseudouridine kinase